MKEIKNYLYNYKIRINNKEVISKALIERNYITNNNGDNVDVNDKLFIINNWFKNIKILQMNRFSNKLLNIINNSKYSYDIELNYYYYKSKVNNNLISRDNDYFEIYINCYDINNKGGFNKRIKVKSLNSKVIDEIFNYENIDYKYVNNEEGVIDNKQIIIEKYAFAQILSLYKVDIFNNIKEISADNMIKICAKGKNNYNNKFYDSKGRIINNELLSKKNKIKKIRINKSFTFYNRNRVDDVKELLEEGFVITNVYFLNNSKESISNIKVLCSGYYLKNKRIEYAFSNKIFSFNIVDIINDIKWVSNNGSFSNQFYCSDVLIDLN